MKKVKIVWLAPFPLDILIPFGLKLTRPVGGHPCSWIVNWAQALSDIYSVNLHIITYSARIKCSQSIEFNGYTVHVIRDAIPFSDKNWEALFDFDAATRFFLRKKKLIKKVRSIQPDIVHGHGTENAYALASVFSGFPSVVSMQGVIAEIVRVIPTRRFKWVVKTEAKAVKNGVNFMCRTHFDKDFVRSHNASANIFHMPEPMNPCFFDVNRSNAEKFRVLYVGGFQELKGLEELLVSIAKVRQQRPEIRVDIVGGGKIKRKKYLFARAQQLGVGENVIFHGFLSANEIAILHSKATVFAITSRNENSPNTLAEALCAGTPSVAFDVGGISSMFIDGESGFLVQPGNTDVLAAKIELLLSSSDLQKRFSENSRRDGLANHPDQVAKSSFHAYQKILEEARGDAVEMASEETTCKQA
ncbi:MAG: glycosyltransferase family 4 protein [Desulfobacterales bacterium]|nr:glycosyltransferase family 4 protein [Desulfobacterales bacterium]